MSAAAEFAERFADFWRAPSPDRLDALLTPDVRLVAPMTPATGGLAAGKRWFATILDLIPDLTAEVHAWGETEYGLLIEFTLAGTAAGRVPVSWDAVDRIVLRADGLASERVSYFDAAPLALRIARHPRAWPALLRSRLRR